MFPVPEMVPLAVQRSHSALCESPVWVGLAMLEKKVKST